MKDGPDDTVRWLAGALGPEWYPSRQNLESLADLDTGKRFAWSPEAGALRGPSIPPSWRCWSGRLERPGGGTKHQGRGISW